MRVKVGDTWYDGNDPDNPIMLELTDADKSNINRMGGMYYCQFNESWDKERIRQWMREERTIAELRLLDPSDLEDEE